MTIGDRIKNRRLELGLSVDQLADKLGKNRATVYRYENNDIENLPTTVLEPLSKALCTTPAALMGWSEDDSNFHITRTEKNLVISYRRAPESRKEAVRALLEIDDQEKSAGASAS